MTNISIQVDKLSYSYAASPHLALDNVSFAAQTGSFIALMGANNSGKSTLCQALTGFIPHFHHGEMSGRVLVGGLDTSRCQLSDLVQMAGLVFQNPGNQLSGARFTVREEVAFGLENMGVPRAEMQTRIENILNLVGIRNLADVPPHELSGGQQQLAALAAMLVLEHQILVLDEPTSALDPSSSQRVFKLLHFWSRQGRTVILVERKLEEIAEYCDRVLVLAAGKIVRDGPPAKVLTDAAMNAYGIGRTRFTHIAEQAAGLGFWPTGHPLPVTLRAALSGFEQSLKDSGS